MNEPAKIVEEYLRLHMIPDAARRSCAPEMEIRFTGKRLKMEVWNDSAEWLLVRAGQAQP